MQEEGTSDSWNQQPSGSWPIRFSAIVVRDKGYACVHHEVKSRHKMETLSQSLNHSFVRFSYLGGLGFGLWASVLFLEGFVVYDQVLLSALFPGVPDLASFSLSNSSFSCFLYTLISSPKLSTVSKQELYLYSSFLDEFYMHNYNFSFYYQK